MLLWDTVDPFDRRSEMKVGKSMVDSGKRRQYRLQDSRKGKRKTVLC